MTHCRNNIEMALKKEYNSPQLTCFGLLRSLTQAGSGSANESASNPCPQTDLTRKYNANCMA